MLGTLVYAEFTRLCLSSEHRYPVKSECAPVFELIVFSVFPLAMIAAAVSDIFSMTISNRLTLALAAAFPLVALYCGIDAQQILMHISAGVAMLTLGFALFAFGWIGGGDAKFFAATAIWLGWSPLFEYALVASLIGGALTLLIVVARGVPMPSFLKSQSWLVRLHDAKHGIPYGVALAGAGLIVYPGTELVPMIIN